MSDPAHMHSAASGLVVDYRWSLGANPFGPQSSSTRLGAGLRNAALRNVALLQLNSSVTHLVKVVIIPCYPYYPLLIPSFSIPFYPPHTYIIYFLYLYIYMIFIYHQGVWEGAAQ